MVLSLHKQPFVTTHFQFITAHFVRHCALKKCPGLDYVIFKLSNLRTIDTESLYRL